jgi:hypothetical protein
MGNEKHWKDLNTLKGDKVPSENVVFGVGRVDLVDQVVVCLPSKYEAQSSNPSNSRKEIIILSGLPC